MSVVYKPVAFLTISGAIMSDFAHATFLSLRQRVNIAVPASIVCNSLRK